MRGEKERNGKSLFLVHSVLFSFLLLPVLRRHPCGGRDPEHGHPKASPIHDGHSLSNRRLIEVSLSKDIPLMKSVCQGAISLPRSVGALDSCLRRNDRKTVFQPPSTKFAIDP